MFNVKDGVKVLVRVTERGNFGFLDTETCKSKAVLFSVGYIFSIHPRARVWDISISLNCVVITLFLLIVF